mgnify:CR=1 FL=1
MEKENTSKTFEHEHEHENRFEHAQESENVIDLSTLFRNFFRIFFRRLWVVILAAVIGMVALKVSLPRLWAISSRIASVEIMSEKVLTTCRAAVVS